MLSIDRKKDLWVTLAVFEWIRSRATTCNYFWYFSNLPFSSGRHHFLDVCEQFHQGVVSRLTLKVKCDRKANVKQINLKKSLLLFNQAKSNIKLDRTHSLIDTNHLHTPDFFNQDPRMSYFSHYLTNLKRVCKTILGPSLDLDLH